MSDCRKAITEKQTSFLCSSLIACRQLPNFKRILPPKTLKFTLVLLVAILPDTSFVHRSGQTTLLQEPAITNLPFEKDSSVLFLMSFMNLTSKNFTLSQSCTYILAGRGPPSVISRFNISVQLAMPASPIRLLCEQ